MAKTFKINENHKRWAKSATRKYKQTIKFWLNLIQKQDGKCALTGAPLFFDAKNGTPQKGGSGCHPLYASADHINPKYIDRGFQILCYDINDLKGHLPIPLFNALNQTKEWKRFIKKWETAAKLSKNKQTFKKLIGKGA
ncbi:MAG: hypothetical protein Q7K16_01705 [Candidatus Azambacteria bacterium]|nr:hypothetical protein [Candidatus Azambacteria bacterium]